VRALSEYKSGARKNPIMKGFAAGLSTQDMEDLAAYFSSQAPGVVSPHFANLR
jgi:cytochrome c553